MKRMLYLTVLLPIMGLTFYGYISAKDKTDKKEKTGMVEASGKALWDHLKKESYEKKWKMWPGKTALYPSSNKEAHGDLLTTYVNDAAYKAITEKKGMLPDGAIIAKENYSADKKYKALTVMYKVKGYNPEGNDWFWAMYDPTGKIEGEGKSGKVEPCIKCHETKKDNDYVLTQALK